MSHYIMLWKYSMNYKEAYSGVSTAWYTRRYYESKGES